MGNKIFFMKKNKLKREVEDNHETYNFWPNNILKGEGSMKKKKFFIVFAAVCAASLLTILVANDSSLVANSSSSGSNNSSVYNNFGELTKEQIEISKSNAGETAITARDFSITDQYIDNLTKQNELTGIDAKAAEQMALSQIIVKQSLYYYAINNGFIVNEEEIVNSLEKNKAMIRKADNYSDFLEFLDGLGMDEEQYWEDQYELYKLNYVVGQYKASVKENYIKENMDAMDADALQSGASEEMLGIAQNAVEAENIKISGGYSWSFSATDTYIGDLCSY